MNSRNINNNDEPQETARQKDLGEPTPWELRNGPLENRSCTDILACFCYVLFSIACIMIFIYSTSAGDPKRLAQPYDPDHRACGLDLAVKNFPYIYFVSPMPKQLYRTVCVRECPKKPPSMTVAAFQSSSLDCVVNQVVTSCAGHPAAGNDQVLIYDSVPFGGRMCVPYDLQEYSKIKQGLQISKIQVWVQDIQGSYQVILAGAGLAVFFRAGAGCVIWSFIIITITCFLLLGTLFLQKYSETNQIITPPNPHTPAPSLLLYDGIHTIHEMVLKHSHDLVPQPDFNFETFILAENSADANTKKLQESSQAYKILAIVFYIMAGLAVFFVCCFQTRIKLSIAVLKCSARFMMENTTIFLVPIIVFLFAISYYIYWVFGMIYLYSAGEVSKEPQQLPFGQFHMNATQQNYAAIRVFQLFWKLTFIESTNQFIIFGAVIYWYFAQQSNDNHVFKSVYILFRYHIGTVAYASFLLAFVDYLKSIVESLEKEANEKTNDATTKFILKCLVCCCVCIVSLLQMINKNSFAYTIMEGSDYCTSAQHSIQLMWRNPIRFSSVEGIASLFEFTGKMAISILTTFICFKILTSTESYKTSISTPILPTLLIFLISLTIANLFMSLFGAAADGLIVVFTMDEEIHEGRSQDHYERCPGELREFLIQAGQPRQ